MDWPLGAPLLSNIVTISIIISPVLAKGYKNISFYSDNFIIKLIFKRRVFWKPVSKTSSSFCASKKLYVKLLISQPPKFGSSFCCPVIGKPKKKKNRIMLKQAGSTSKKINYVEKNLRFFIKSSIHCVVICVSMPFFSEQNRETEHYLLVAKMINSCTEIIQFTEVLNLFLFNPVLRRQGIIRHSKELLKNC